MGRKKSRSASREPDRPSPVSPKPEGDPYAPLVEWLAAAALAVTAIFLHVVAFRHQGALWRDESNAVEMGRMTLGEAWNNLAFDSILMGPILMMRAMALSGLSGNDTALRALGMTLGILILAALFWAAWPIARRPPVVALLLFALWPVAIRYGDSMRAYPLATLTIVIAFGLLARAVSDPTPRAITWAALGGAVAVQCSYLNLVLVGALTAGALASTLRSRNLRHAALLSVPGLAALASALAYVGRMQSTWAVLDVQRRTLHTDEMLDKVEEALTTPSPVYAWLWALAAAAAAVAAVRSFRSRPPETEATRPDWTAFLGTAFGLAALVYVLFLKRAGVEPNPWHFIPLLSVCALCLDGLIAWGATVSWIRVGTAAAVVAGGIAAFPHADRFMRERHTNVDRVAEILNEQATSDDVIVVTSLHCGVSFARYYRGKAPWTTLPPIDDHRVHRYDLLKAAMMSPDPLAPVLRDAEAALRGGHRVFAVVYGGMFQKKPFRPETPVVPNPDWGWHAGRHFSVWTLQFGYFLQTHATQSVTLVRPQEGVSGYENLQLLAITGWAPREAP